MKDIPQYKEWIKSEQINKGWSNDKKYYIETQSGENLLLRLSDVSEYDKKQAEYDAIKKLDNFDIFMSRPLAFGICNNGKSVYSILSWLDGEDAEKVLPALSEKEQYKLGIKSGQILRQIHSIPAPVNQTPWSERFNRKIDRKIEGIKIAV
jgi:aminoglycoside phosphotransferase (APT) family kinase protein